MKKSDFIFTITRILMDGFMLFGALILAYLLRMEWFMFQPLPIYPAIELFPPPTTLFPFSSFLEFSWQFTLLFLFIFALHGRYRFGTDEKALDEMRNIFWALAAGMALLSVYFFMANFQFFSRLIFILSWIFAFFLLVFGRIFLRSFRLLFWKFGIGRKRLIILGSGTIAQHLIAQIKKKACYEILGTVSEKLFSKRMFEGIKVLGSFSDFEKILQQYNPDQVILASEKSSETLTQNLIETSHQNHTKFRFVPDAMSLDLAAMKISTINTIPIISLYNSKISGWGYLLKTAIDYWISVIFLILLCPIFILVALCIWISNPKAPIFYNSKRVGKNGKLFWCHKFRTMVPKAEELKKELENKNERKGGVLFKIEKDPRITRFGRFLRKFSIDEWPQVFNVLKGEMSFIGPRPHLESEVKKYPKHNLQILAIKPGITGFAQINGRSQLSFEEEMSFENFYMKNWTLWLDFVIFWKSIFVVLKGENAS